MKEILGYLPQNGAESSAILQWMERYGDQLLTRMPEGHLTAAGFIFNPERTKALMIYHNIYRSWAWTGGHADGERDLLAVALRETREESGLEAVRPVSERVYSVEILTVDGHEKRGVYVPSHLHLNVTYLLEGDPASPVRCRPEENSRVGWFALADAPAVSSEPWMRERIYRKLNAKLSAFPPMNLQ